MPADLTAYAPRQQVYLPDLVMTSSATETFLLRRNAGRSMANQDSVETAAVLRSID